MSKSRRSRPKRQRSSGIPEYAASVQPGLEEIAGQEIEKKLIGARVIDSQRGWTVFGYEGDAADVLRLRTTEDVFVLLFRTAALPSYRKDAIPLLARMAARSRYWDQAMTRFQQTHRPVKRITLRVIAQMTGRHGFRRQEVSEAVLSGVLGRWHRWKPVNDDAHAEVWAPIVGNWAAIGLRLSDHKMRHRTYKEEHRPASLRPSMAAAMIALSRPRPDDRFCDPMCGTGTILAERALYGPFRRLLGGDLDVDVLSAAEVNLSRIRETARKRILQHWDACALPVRSGSLDVVVSNLPFGEQIGSHDDNILLYRRFFRQLVRMLCPGGRAVLLSSEKELMRELIHSHEQLSREREVLVGVLGQAARIYVLHRNRR
jgi:23S rRNA G2445 N2-methylase RlmL